MKNWKGAALLVFAAGCDAATVMTADWSDDPMSGGVPGGGGGNPDLDSDGDGFTDGQEAEQGTDPNDASDVPYAGGWPKGDCRNDMPENGGYRAGDIVDNFSAIDQYGEEVYAHDFCDRALFVVASAGW